MSSVDTAARAEVRPLSPSAAGPASSGRLSTFVSLRYPNFRLLWTGTVFMSAGQWIQQVTLGWLVYDMTSSAALLGVLGAVRTLPFLFVSPTAGVIADRIDRRVLLIRAQWFVALSALAMGALVATGNAQVWHLFVFTISTGVAWSFIQPARMALVPAVVPRSDLMNATALNSLGFNITKIIGPSIGGLLIALFGAGGNFFVQAAAYTLVTWAVYQIHIPPNPTAARGQSIFTNLKEGLEYVRTTPSVLAILLLALVPSVLALPYMALMPVFARDVLGVGPDGLGLMLAAPGVGAVLSTLGLATAANRMRRRGFFLLGSLVLLGVFLVLFSRTASLPLALAALVGVGACHIFFASASSTTIQLIVPDVLRGRVMSLYMLDVGLAPAGTLVAGLITQAWGGPFAVALLGGSVVLATLVIGWRIPQVRQLSV